MANEFKVKKGLIVEGSGSVILDVQGSQGQLFSITDDLTGDIFSVSDISGVPILNVNADGTTTFDGNVTLKGPETLDSTSDTSIKFLTRDSAGIVKYHSLGSNAFNSTTYNNYSLPLSAAGTRGGVKIGYTESGKNYPVELSSEKMYVNVPWTDTNTQIANTNTQNTAAEIRTKIGGGNNGHVPTVGTAGHFLKHDGTFGIPSYTTNTNTTYSVGAGGLTQQNFTTTLKDKLDGIAASANNYSFPYTVSTSAGGSTVVQRHSDGYIFANYFNTTPNTTDSGVTQVCVETGNDGYIRHGTATAIRTFLGVADGSLSQNNFTNADHTKLNGIATGANNFTYTLPLGSSSTRGGFKIGYSESGKNYPVELSSEKMYVNVPWVNTDTNTTYTVRDGELSEINFTDEFNSKLESVEQNATADQTAAQIRSLVGTGNSNFVPSAGTSGHFLKHDGTFGLPSYTTNTDTNTTYNFEGSLFYSRNSSNSLTIDSVTTNTVGYCTGATAAGYSDGGMFTAAYSTDWVSQIFSNFRNGELASRAKNNGTWTAWRRQWDTVNLTNLNQLTNGPGYVTSDTNTTYSADGNYGITLSGTTFRLEDDRRRNSTSADVYTGNTHDYVFFDASHGMRFYTAGSEDMRLDNSGNLHVDADVVAYSTTISDERLKDNITTIENPLDKIKALRGVEYDWNSGTRKGKHDLGLIAQEVEKVLPNIVHEHEMPFLNDDEEDTTLYKTVDYEKMVAVLIEGMKEQQNQIDSLKSELTEIKRKS